MFIRRRPEEKLIQRYWYQNFQLLLQLKSCAGQNSGEVIGEVGEPQLQSSYGGHLHGPAARSFFMALTTRDWHDENWKLKFSKLIRRPVDFFSNYLVSDRADDVVERNSFPDFSRRGSLYRKKPFRPQLDDIHEEEELALLAALKSNSSDADDDDDDDFVLFEGGKNEILTEKTLESLSMLSVLGLDFW